MMRMLNTLVVGMGKGGKCASVYIQGVPEHYIQALVRR